MRVSFSARSTTRTASTHCSYERTTGAQWSQGRQSRKRVALPPDFADRHRVRDPHVGTDIRRVCPVRRNHTVKCVKLRSGCGSSCVPSAERRHKGAIVTIETRRDAQWPRWQRVRGGNRRRDALRCVGGAGKALDVRRQLQAERPHVARCAHRAAQRDPSPRWQRERSLGDHTRFVSCARKRQTRNNEQEGAGPADGVISRHASTAAQQLRSVRLSRAAALLTARAP